MVVLLCPGLKIISRMLFLQTEVGVAAPEEQLTLANSYQYRAG